MRIGLAQINTTVGDIGGNADKVVEWAARAADEGCDLVLFPELTLPGYPGEDLYLQPHFAAASARALETLADRIADIPALIGFAEPAGSNWTATETIRSHASAFNSLALISEGRVQTVYRKMALPNHAVFDELRQFLPGDEPQVVTIAGHRIGLTICEDCWNGGGPARLAVEAGAELLLNASASPWYLGRGREREANFARLAGELGLPIAVCNLVGAQDGLVFDGQSLVAGPQGTLARAGRFGEELLVVDLSAASAPVTAADSADLEELRQGLCLGLRDYVVKNGFAGVVLGLSGGIDSALVAALAVEALGPDQVTCIVMPSPHSSRETQADAREMARRIGARLVELPIGAAMQAYVDTLEGAGETAGGVTVENIQARIRGNFVMALSNRDGLLALSCGNKSEACVGYATLYGDMAGGLAPIKDLLKTRVYALAAHLNSTGLRSRGADGTAISEPIPPSILDRAPSAELRPGQRDTDSLPPYDLLDAALEAHVERDLSREEMIAEGIDADVADRVIDLVKISEHKRHQAAPGIRATAKALDRDRRIPITNRYRAASE